MVSYLGLSPEGTSLSEPDTSVSGGVAYYNFTAPAVSPPMMYRCNSK
jgi:hypothetical protein